MAKWMAWASRPARCARARSKDGIDIERHFRGWRGAMSASVIAQLGPKLPADLLARRTELPRKPAGVELSSDRLAVRPYRRSDGEELHSISNGAAVERLGRAVRAYDADALVWRFLPAGPFGDEVQLVAFHDWVESLPDARAFVVADRPTGQLVGSLSYLASDPTHLKVEIGNVWYTPAVQRAGVNAEATMLLVRHAVRLGYQRIEWKCHVDNHRSRRAALALGFRFEGIQEGHYIIKDRRRDTAWYRMLAEELATSSGTP